MSQTETHTGKLIPVPEMGSEKEFISIMLNDKFGDQHRPEQYDTDREWFEEEHEHGRDYHFHNSTVYRVDDKDISDMDICQASLSHDGSISYTVQFYNGGTCLPEMLNYALAKMDES